MTALSTKLVNVRTSGANTLLWKSTSVKVPMGPIGPKTHFNRGRSDVAHLSAWVGESAGVDHIRVDRLPIKKFDRTLSDIADRSRGDRLGST